MELQIRIAFETAEMFEYLKEYYQETTGINFTKGDVLQRLLMILMIYGQKLNGKILRFILRVMICLKEH